MVIVVVLIAFQPIVIVVIVFVVFLAVIVCGRGVRGVGGRRVTRSGVGAVIGRKGGDVIRVEVAGVTVGVVVGVVIGGVRVASGR